MFAILGSITKDSYAQMFFDPRRKSASSRLVSATFWMIHARVLAQAVTTAGQGGLIKYRNTPKEKGRFNYQNKTRSD